MHGLLQRCGFAIGALALGLLAKGAYAGETVLTLDNGVAATLNLPDGATNAPAVLMLHGFGSSRDEVGNMYKREAEALAAKGVASLRIDFRGFGKSDGDTGATTVDGQLEDAENALAYLKTVKGVDPAKLGVLGFSLGGGIAILTASKHPDEVKSLVTWSSVGDFHKDMLGGTGQEAFDTANAKGVVGLDLGWRTIVLKKEFFASLDKFALDQAIASYPGAYLAIAGSEDFSAAYTDKYVAAAKGSPKEASIMKGEDHIYHSLSDDQAGADAVIGKTAEWFAKTL